MRATSSQTFSLIRTHQVFLQNGHPFFRAIDTTKETCILTKKTWQDGGWELKEKGNIREKCGPIKLIFDGAVDSRFYIKFYLQISIQFWRKYLISLIHSRIYTILFKYLHKSETWIKNDKENKTLPLSVSNLGSRD